MDNTRKGLSAWQLTMMSLGTVIGGSFFLGTAIAIKAAGPSIFISYILGGILVFFILYALSEMTVADPNPGSFRMFAKKAYGPGLGFITGWVYWTGMVLAMSSEAAAVSIFIRSWFPNVSISLLGSLIIIGVTILNLFGADRLSKIESSLSSIKIFAIIGFIVLSLALIIGLVPGISPIHFGELNKEPWFPSGIGGIAGSMLIVMFAYAGFEVIGLAASESSEPHKTVPRAITYTVIALVGMYVSVALLILPLVPTRSLTTSVSPMVLAMSRWGLTWAGNVMNIVLITAVLSTMLAAMFGLGRMIRSLADEGDAPIFLKDKGDIPYRGILFSGASMLLGLFLGLLLPQSVYIFLVSSGGFSLLFVYLIILISHYRLRKINGCPPNGNCQFPGYPYTSYIAIASIIAIIISMPLIPGQGSGLLAGLMLVGLYTLFYFAKKYFALTLTNAERNPAGFKKLRILSAQNQAEVSDELKPKTNKDDKNK